jgi:CDP-glucose 4,6-dehydratase
MNVYKQSKVLVTGDTGFKGSWLTNALEMLGADVYGISYDPDLKIPAVEHGLPIERRLQIDIRNGDELSAAIKQIKPDLIFHLAAQSLVIESYSNPKYTFEVNLQGTLNVLEAATRNLNTKGVIVTTTDKVYRNDETGIKFRESDPLGGTDPYSASKSCASLAIQAWRASNRNDCQFIDVRAGNVFGGGDRAINRIIPDLIRAVQSNKPLELRNPNSIRPWQHVLEPILGYLIIGEKILNREKISNTYNLGPSTESEISVTSLVSYFKNDFTDLRTIMNDKDDSALKESQILRLDSSLAEQELSWTPTLNVEQGTRLTSEWEKAYNLNPEGSSEVTRNQITRFMKLKGYSFE